jgi:phospho-N-acetylmuramoyl-pentapeptide-transferase
VKTVLLSAAVSMFIALFGTPLAIKAFTRRGLGQEIRSDGPAHLSKRGTPTMGGTVIIIAALAGYLIGHLATGDPMSASGLLVLFLMTGLGLVGFADDFIKLYMQRSLGLRSGAKLAGQAVVGGVFALLAIRFPDPYDLTPPPTPPPPPDAVGSFSGPMRVGCQKSACACERRSWAGSAVAHDDQSCLSACST